ALLIRVAAKFALSVLMFLPPPVAPRFPALIIKFTGAGFMALYDLARFAVRSPTDGLDGRSTGTEVVPVIKAAARRAQGIGVMANMTLPDPLEGIGWWRVERRKDWAGCRS
ncbi:hypothetical protein LTS18_006931, partial [Coniosporium uncinatum]